MNGQRRYVVAYIFVPFTVEGYLRTSFVLDESNKKAIMTTERDKIPGQLSEHTF